jgi:hypothetical protein
MFKPIVLLKMVFQNAVNQAGKSGALTAFPGGLFKTPAFALAQPVL